MRPYNFLRAFRIALFYEPGLFSPRAGITANASAVDRHAKELGKKPGKYCESDVVVTGFSAEHLR